MNNLIIRYPKDSNKNKIGCFISVYNGINNEVTVGWSVYNSKREDRQFDKKLAKTIAFGRIRKGITGARFPDYMKEHLENFLLIVKHKLSDDVEITVV